VSIRLGNCESTRRLGENLWRYSSNGIYFLECGRILKWFNVLYALASSSFFFDQRNVLTQQLRLFWFGDLTESFDLIV
jgi:hypothetical protein